MRGSCACRIRQSFELSDCDCMLSGRSACRIGSSWTRDSGFNSVVAKATADKSMSTEDELAEIIVSLMVAGTVIVSVLMRDNPSAAALFFPLLYIILRS
ncbi:hypothetical protein DPMN_032651 [Dreissena polymorpha]|uniref:Uncharacterized protein n=1 Tax=Dreissena polymorpha TaxID=45954 RepID=A0A9D4M258_DREPO|nr:hypothetical protein DPMN_032651 [Dreissena polymorpha]